MLWTSWVSWGSWGDPFASRLSWGFPSGGRPAEFRQTVGRRLDLEKRPHIALNASRMGAVPGWEGTELGGAREVGEADVHYNV